MKILFAGRSIDHFSYYQTILTSLNDHGNKIHILFDREWSKSLYGNSLEKLKARFPQIDIDWSIRRSDGWRQSLFKARELRTFASYVARKNQSEFYRKRWQAYLSPYLNKKLENTFYRNLIGCTASCKLLKFFESMAPPDYNIAGHLEHIHPDVVVASPVNMRFSEEIEYVKAAKHLKIPTAVPVYSWDNLTTKGLFHVLPDILLAWNKTQATEATVIHGISEKKIVVTGAPFFDKWFGHALKEGRSEFLSRIGLSPKEQYMVYLGSSANIAQDESWLVEELYHALRNHADPKLRRLNLLVRPHPANSKIFENLKRNGLAIWPPKGALPEAKQAQLEFYNSIFHSVCVFGINTSGMIDAIIMDKPCHTIFIDRYRSTHFSTTHFKSLLNSDVLEKSNSIQEALQCIARNLDGDDTTMRKRGEFIRNFIRPWGLERSAGEVAANAIECLAGGMRPESVAAKFTTQ